jgi:transposase-like protein
MIKAIVKEELEATLGAGRSQRVGAVRTGYRHGARERQLTTSLEHINEVPPTHQDPSLLAG